MARERLQVKLSDHLAAQLVSGRHEVKACRVRGKEVSITFRLQRPVALVKRDARKGKDDDTHTA